MLKRYSHESRRNILAASFIQVHRSLHQFAAFLGFNNQTPNPPNSAYSIVSPSNHLGQIPAYQPITKDLVGDSTVYVRSHPQSSTMVPETTYETGIRLKEVAPASGQDAATLYIRRAPQQGHAPQTAQSQLLVHAAGDAGYSRQQPSSTGVMSHGMMISPGVANGSLVVARTPQAPPASAPPQAPAALHPPSAPVPSQFAGAQHIMSASAQDIVGESTIYIRHAPQQVTEAPSRAAAPAKLVPLKLPGHCEGMPIFIEQVRSNDPCYAD